MVLLVLLAGCAMDCGGDAVLQTPDPGAGITIADLDVTLEGLRAVFCHCLHGCGPGISGHIAFTVTNRASRALNVGLQRLELVKRGSNAPAIVDLDHPHPFNDMPFTDLASGASREYDFPLQIDVDALDEGSYGVHLVLAVDGGELDEHVADHDMVVEPNPDCAPR